MNRKKEKFAPEERVHIYNITEIQSEMSLGNRFAAIT